MKHLQLLLNARYWIGLTLFLLITPTVQAQIYVDADAGGANDGARWTDAYNSLQDALAAAVSGNEIWVAEGMYYPDEGAGQTDNNRSATFQLKNGVEIYGGFDPDDNADEFNERDWTTYPTILSGDIDHETNPDSDVNGVVTNTDDIAGNNAYNVVTSSGTDDTAILNGFTITAGYANGTLPANIRGGGVYNYGGTPELTSVTFSGNSANIGGGMYNANGGTPELTNVTITGNSASSGGGMANEGSSPKLTGVTFFGNSAGNGGGMFNIGGGIPELTNVTITGNSASSGGGIYNGGSNPTLVNVIIWHNQAGGSTTSVSASIFNSGSTPSISYSLIANSGGSGVDWDTAIGDDDGNNMDENPKFVEPVNPYDAPNAAGNLRLSSLSRAINAGNPATDLSLFPTDSDANPIDFAGSPRVYNGDTDIIDIGAYEFQGEPFFINPDGSNIVYVKTEAEGTEDGSSWSHATDDLQAAIDADGVEQVWVATGVYYPDEATGQATDDRRATFQLVDGVAIYGGFAGTEGPGYNLDSRDFEANTTILSGDIDHETNPDTDVNGVVTDTDHIEGSNAYNVVTSSGTDDTAILNGFIITAGNANGVGGPTNTNKGGGMYNDGGSPSLAYLTFTGNNASGAGGGGMFNSGGSPVLTNVTFTGNSTNNFGGGIYNSSNSSPVLTNVTFSGNSANDGGGMYNWSNSSPVLTNVILWGNQAGGSTTSVSASIFNYDSTPSISHSLIANSGGSGGWDSAFGTDGGNNLDADPLFSNASDPIGADNIFGTHDDGLALTNTSPAINMGSNTPFGIGGSAEGITTDLAGNDRVFDGTPDPDFVDMGAYELQEEPVLLILPNGNNVLFVDQTVSGGNSSGSSWADAIPELRDALAWAGNDWNGSDAPLQIWVADGLYLPTNDDTDNEATFQLVNDVEIYGGFDGGEANITDRDWTTNLTILSGDIGGDDTTTDGVVTDTDNIRGVNSLHVVSSSSNTSSTLLDGFTITGGIANHSTSPANFGGGMLVIDGAPTLVNNIFTGSKAESGGGLLITGSSNVSMENLTFMNNTSASGGGLYVQTSSTAILSNGIVVGNTARLGGGIINKGDLTLLNTTIIDNNATRGGGLDNSGSGQKLDMQNSIVLNNTVNGNPNAGTSNIYHLGGSATYTHSLIGNSGGSGTNWDTDLGTDGGNNIDADPRFTDPASGDYTLQNISPAINAGDPATNLSLFPGGPDNPEDLAGNPRVFDGTPDPDVIDIGAYEFQEEPYAPFITTWKTDNNGESGDQSIRIPMIGNGYNFSVAWGDLTGQKYSANPGDGVVHYLEHTYSSSGTYTIEITGEFPRIYSFNADDRDKIVTVEQWGNIEWSSMEGAFWGASEMNVVALDAPDLSNVESMLTMFREATSMNGNINHWNTENVNNMYAMFDGASSFNQDLDQWNTGNVTSMAEMFSEATAFNGDISTWNTEKVENMRDMFSYATAFNGDLSDWKTGGTISMEHMFNGATAFNGDIGEWDASHVLYMNNMFQGAISFNQDISGWQTTSLFHLSRIFSGATMFNQDISGWDVSRVEYMWDVFLNAEAFNQDLSNWDISRVKSMSEMFDNSGMSTQNYDATLIGWEAQTVQSGVELGALGLTYCDAELARESLISDDNWTITGDDLAVGCKIPEGEDQRILVGNNQDHTFSGENFGVSNSDFSIIIESMPVQGDLKYDGDTVGEDAEVSITDINNDMLTWSPPEDGYGYNFTSFDFRIMDDIDNQSENPYTLTIDLAAHSVVFTGNEGWRFLASPVNSETVGSFLDPIWTQGFSASDSPGADFVNVQFLDQDNYQWSPADNASNPMSIGQAAIVYVYSDDDNSGVDEGFPKTLSSSTTDWQPLDGTFGGALSYDDLQDGMDDDNESFFLLGNPHPIAIDFCQTQRTNVANNMDVWDPNFNAGDYRNLSCSLGNVEIAPFQGYWVRVTDDSNSYVITENSYMNGQATGYFKDGNREEQFLITMNLTGGEENFSNRIDILLDEQGTAETDFLDAPKLSPAGFARKYLSFYSLDESARPYALQSLPMEIDGKISIPLNVETTEAGRFTLDWDLPESQIFNGSYFLLNNDTGEVIELREGSSYSFDIDPSQAVKVSGEKRSAKSFGDFADLEEASNPRFQLLIAASGVDGFTELGAIPEAFELGQNYPNPFNPTTVINYQLPVNSEVRLEVYDMLGRNVATLVSGQVSAGRHTVNFDADNLSSGIYLYRLQAGSQVMTRKLTVVK